LTSLYGHSIGEQLTAGHWTLTEIDAQFKNLVNERRIPNLVGVEAYENHFIFHRKWLPDRSVVVPKESAGRYFDAPKLLPGTNHFTSVKPTSRKHPTYELLADFFEQHFGTSSAQSLQNYPSKLSFVFERNPQYPTLRFSVANDSATPVQIINIHVFKVASLKDDHGLIDHLMGPRVRLEFNLKTAAEGKGTELLQGQVSSLQPGTAEAFEIELDTENAVSLIDFEAEYVDASAKHSLSARPRDVVLVHAPTEFDRGQISALARKSLFDSLLSGAPVTPWRSSTYQSCNTHIFAMLRGAATLGLNNQDESWELLKNKFEQSNEFGYILASYADGLDQGITPASAKAYLTRSISDPIMLRRLTVTDNEAVSVTITRALQRSDHDSELAPQSNIPTKSEYEIRLLDRLLEISPLIDEPDDDEDKPGSVDISKTLGFASSQVMRAELLNKVAQEWNTAAVEFLIATLVIQPQLYHEINDILCELLHEKETSYTTSFTHDEDEIVKRWWGWWAKHRSTKFSSLGWSELSPRLSRAFTAFQAPNSQALNPYLLDNDEVVRFAAARTDFLTPGHLEILARDDRPLIRLRVVHDARTSLALLRVLAKDKNSIVRRWVSKNPNVDKFIVDELKNDQSAGVRKFVLESNNGRV
jgi:hypothetical protein